MAEEKDVIDEEQEFAEEDSVEENEPKKTLHEKAEELGVSDREYVSSVSFHNGVLGVITGSIIGFAAAVFQVVHVAISTLVFGERERADLFNVFKKNFLTHMTKNIGDEQTDKAGEEAVKDTKTEKDVKNDRQENKKESNKTDRKNTEYEQESKDSAMGEILNNQEIAKAFVNIGLNAESQKGTDNILLFKTEHKGNLDLQKNFFAMSKDDLLNCNASSLATAIYSYHKDDPGNEDEIKLESSMKALTAVAAIQYLANNWEVNQALAEGKQMELSFSKIETKNGSADLSIKTSKEYKNVVDIEYNGVAVASLPVSELLNQKFSQYQEQLMEHVNKAANFTYPIQIGDTDRITFTRNQDETVLVESGDKNLGTYTFETEADVQKLAYKIKANDLHPSTENKTYNVDALVYTAAAICNPDMKPVRNEKNEVLNAFTGKPEPDGKAHFFLEHDEQGVRIKLYSPQEGKEFNDVLLNQYENSQRMYGNQLEDLITSVEQGRDIIKENHYIDENYTRESSFETKTQGSSFDMPIIVTKQDVKQTIEDANRDDILEGNQPMYQFSDVDQGLDMDSMSADDLDMIAHLETGFSEEEYAGFKDEDIARMDAIMDQQEQENSYRDYDEER